MRLVTLGPVVRLCGVPVSRRTPHVGGNANTTMEDLDRRVSGPRFQLLADQLVRDAVIMTIHFDVIVDVGATTFPLRRRVAFHRQRFESRLIQRGKQRGACPFAFPEPTLVQAL